MGQAGLLFQNDEINIMVDPYLSNSVAKIEPHNYRRVPVDERFFDIRPDVLIITHKHLDHLDPESLDVFFSKYSGMTVLAPRESYDALRNCGIGNNYVLFENGTHWTEKGVFFSGIYAAHSDPSAIGVVIEADKKYYVTGDTLYNDAVVACAKKYDPDVVFLPVNGVGNNMNMCDAARFLKDLGSPLAVPLHVGLFDAKKPQDFEYDNKVCPEFYKEIEL